MRIRLPTAVLYASIFLYSSMMRMALAAPITPGSDVEPHLETFSPFSAGLLRRADRGNVIPSPASLQTPYLYPELEHLRVLKSRIDDMENNDKKVMLDFLQRLATALKQANQWPVSYQRNAIYNAVKDVVNEVLNKWIDSDVRYAVVGFSMECLEWTKPQSGVAELPQEQDLKGLSGRIKEKDPILYQSGRWARLSQFLEGVKNTLLLANEMSFTYDKLAVDEALMNSKSEVEKWGEGITIKRILLIMNNCLALIWVTKEHPPPAAFTTTVGNSHSTIAFSCPATNHFSTSTISAPQSSHHKDPPLVHAPLVHAALERQSYVERRMSGLLANPENLENVFLLPGIMEVVPEDVCIRRVKEWTFLLALMRSCVEELGSQEWALKNIDVCQNTLRSKAQF